MILYQVKNSTGVITNQWYSCDHDENYYDPCFGKKAWVERILILDANGNSVLDANDNLTFTVINHPAEYTVIACQGRELMPPRTQVFKMLPWVYELNKE